MPGKLELPDSVEDAWKLQQSLLQEMEKRNAAKRGPQKYTEFVRDTLGVRLSRAQYVYCRIAYDGDDPVDLPTEFRSLAKKIFGDVERFPAKCRNTIVAVCGARAGKTYIMGALRLLHLALTVDLSTLAPGEPGFGFFVAPSISLATQAVNYVRGAIERTQSLTAMLVGKPTKESIRIRRADGRLVELTIRAASRGGTSVRGGSIFGALLDECAFFRSNDFEVNDEEIYRAIDARIVPGAQIVIASTPWVKKGLLFDFFEENFGHPVQCIAAHAPTLLMLNTQRNREIYESVLRNDPENAAREYGAEFVSSDAETFFSEQWIQASIDPFLCLPRVPKPGDEVKFGCDLGLVSDCSALVGVHAEPDGTHVVAEVCELRPTKTERLRPTDVCRQFVERLRYHYATYVMADSHYRQSMWEILNDNHMTLIDAPSVPSEAYMAAKTRLHEGKVKLPEHPRFLAQLREIRCRRVEGGRFHIIKPRVKVSDGHAGGHGDLVDAWVLAMYQSVGEEVRAAPPKDGTPEHSKMLSEQIRERRRQEVRRQIEHGSGRRPASQWGRKYLQ